ncbi:Cysteine-rich receptor-like protein kinase 2 [Ananas comosus]|uniref:Cysteine-rich receptor-like protein kinase 2 n=1 Tax=Ananas comosus TaxID=4615 RepID=A0A199VLL1_ANACO|nr:Cysteine-rich receptor-like protein kinase 2 [Ananas comosus]
MRYTDRNGFRVCDFGALLVILTCSCFLRTASGDPRTASAGQFCGNSSSLSGSVFAINFVPAMDNLSSAVTSNGYGTAVMGQAPNAVFGLGQCMEDLNPTDCKLCFSEIRSLLPKCYPNTTGRLYLDGCFGRYANYSFFNDAIDSLDQSVCTTGNNSASPNDFGKAVGAVIGNVTTEAIRSNKGYAVASASVANTSAYALAQCWQNLSQSLCSTCLNAAASSIVSCLPAVEGRALFAGCYMRYSTKLFWNVYPNGSGSSGTNNVVWIVVGSVLGVLFLIFVILASKKALLWRKAKALRDMYKAGIPAAISQSSLTFKYEDLRKASGNFSVSNKLGQGSYGTVYKAVHPDGKEVAVKRLFLNTRQWVDQFFNEVNLISQVRHKNLVKLLGCSVDGPESLLVYEYYANRSLDLFLFDANHEKNLGWEQRIDIVQGVAEGLSYLHEESETRIIHRDIKASNILLDDKFKPKITDFGLARAFSEEKTHLTTGVAGTLGYLAPEYVVHGHLTEKADVYSYGVLVLEVVTGKRCGGSIGSRAGHLLLSKVWNHYKNNTIEEIVDEGIYEESAKEDIMHVIQIGLLCTQANPGDRPTMAKVVELLRKRRHDWELILNDPPFFDVETAEDVGDADVSRLLSTSSAPNISRSSLSQFGGR